MFSEHNYHLIVGDYSQFQHQLCLTLRKGIAATLKHPIFINTAVSAVKHETVFGVMLVELSDTLGNI